MNKPEVLFKPENHQYVSPDGSIIWSSVTSVIGKYKSPFDAMAMSEKSSRNRKSKWYKMDPERIREIWKGENERAVKFGTWYHDQREKDIISCDTISRDGLELPIFRSLDDNGVKTAPDQRLVAGIYPEHFVYLKSAGICGQVDRVEVYNNQVDIYDYKTSKEIKTEPYVNWEGTKSVLRPPLNHVPDCNFWHYALQLSFYMYMVLKHNPRLKPGKMQLQHIIFKNEGDDEYGNKRYILDHEGNPIIHDIVNYDVPYMKNEIISIINDLREQRNDN